MSVLLPVYTVLGTFSFYLSCRNNIQKEKSNDADNLESVCYLMLFNICVVTGEK